MISLFTISSSCKPQAEKLPPLPNNTFENGDLIYRLGNSFFSNTFKKTSRKEHFYSHAGIIDLINDTIFVIHTEASEITGIGGVKKEPLDIFLQNVSIWGVYRLDTIKEVRDSVTYWATKYLEKDIPFDFDFDNVSEDKLYCTELVAKAINKAMARSIIKPYGVKYYAIDDTYLNDKTKLIFRQLSE